MPADDTQDQANKKTYEVNIRILGNEVFAIGIKTSSDSNRWVAIGLVTIFCMMTLLGAYGERLIQLYKSLLGTP